MLESLNHLSETHIVGSRCQERVLDSGDYPVLKNAPFVWVGHSVLRAPYRIVRMRSVYSHIVVSVSGRGRTVIEGEVVDFEPGQILLGPVGKYHAFEIQGSEPWRIAWVFFDDHEVAPVLRGKQAKLVTKNGAEFVTSLRMLMREASGAAQLSVLSAQVTLLDTYARRLVDADPIDPRLWRLWESVESDLANPWTVKKMAKIASVSEEHLRRLCQRFLQRSPLEHLTCLRMRRASTLLRAGDEKLDAIARRIGYSSLYSFSAAFKRLNGMSPSRFRKQQGHPFG